MEQVGKITHYFSKIGVAVVELTGNLKTGETIHIKGHTTDITMPVKSMQIEHEKVNEAKSGQSIGLKVPEHVRGGDLVYRAE